MPSPPPRRLCGRDGHRLGGVDIGVYYIFAGGWACDATGGGEDAMQPIGRHGRDRAVGFPSGAAASTTWASRRPHLGLDGCGASEPPTQSSAPGRRLAYHGLLYGISYPHKIFSCDLYIQDARRPEKGSLQGVRGEMRRPQAHEVAHESL